MPASRWNENLFDILSWIEEENALEELLNLRPITPQVIEQSGDEQEVTEKENGGSGQIPAELPVLPLPGSRRHHPPAGAGTRALPPGRVHPAGPVSGGKDRSAAGNRDGQPGS